MKRCFRESRRLLASRRFFTDSDQTACGFAGGMLLAMRALLLLLTAGTWVSAEEYSNKFEGDEVSCKVFFDDQRVQLRLHERTNSLAYSGQGAERLQFMTQDQNVSVVLECPVQPARVFDELRIEVAAYSNRPGTELAARIVFPNQIDPETGQPVTRLIIGDSLTEATKWQKLTCSTSDSIIAKHLILWRASLKPQELDPRGMYVDRIYLRQILGKGLTEIMIDDLKMSPIVSPTVEAEQVVTPTSSRPQGPQIDFQLDSLSVDGRELFPVILPYQKEPTEMFDRLGANVVWIDNYLNRDLIRDLNERGIWATAWPPSVKSEQGQILDAVEGSLAPFGPETDGILFWNLGVRIQPEAHQQLRHWVHQVKSSDRRQNRPVMADVTSEELIFSRDVDLLGISKHILQTPCSMQGYAQHFERRIRRARPGTFVMTWLQTEPSREIADFRKNSGLSPAVIEPEQIRLQTYTALCSGCRGLGYWNWTPLNAEGPGLEERRLVLEQLITELDLLEPFLANGEVIDRFTMPMGRAMGGNRNALNRSESGVTTEEELTCSLVRSEHGLVILISAAEADSQYVPGPLAANDLKILVRSLPESAFLWQITPTGLWPLETSRKSGGTEIRIPRFNMTTALMVATDQGVAQEMERKIQKIQSRSADLSVQLAEAKLDRVTEVDSQLVNLGVGLPEAPQLLDQSKRLLEEARLSLQKQHYHQARDNAEVACQLMRILQRLHWQHAIQHVSAPSSVPHTVCYQTLPDYWDLIQRLGKQETPPSASVIRSASFEDANAMRVEGWTRDLTTSEQIVVYDALDPSNVREGEYSLRMVAVAAENQHVTNTENASVRYQSPPISVKSGDLLHVTGWVKIPRDITDSLEGFRIYDTQFGASCALQWTEETDWHQFQMLRPIWKQEDLKLILELHGLGDVAIDDLKVQILPLPRSNTPPLATAEPAADEPTKTSKPLELLKGLLK